MKKMILMLLACCTALSGCASLFDGHYESVKPHEQQSAGAGDAMVAALAYGWEQKLPFAECAALAMAASAGAVTTIGTKPPTRQIVDELLGLVKLTNCL